MFGTIVRFIAAVAVVGLVGAAGVGIYQAGFVAGAAAEGVTVVPPFAGYGWYGPGWGHGFGLFGFLGAVLFVFLLFGLLKALFGRGPRGAWNGGWGHPSRHGWGHRPDAFRGGPWEDRAREIHEEWHRRHGSDPDADAGGAGTPPRSPTAG